MLQRRKLESSVWCRPKLATEESESKLVSVGQKQRLWASTVSPKRYEKCGELIREWQRYWDIQQRHFVACDVGLSVALLEGKLPADTEKLLCGRLAHSQTK